MRKFSWILALMTALAMVFIACPSGGGSGDFEWDIADPPTWKYIQIPDRSGNWHSIDIKVKDNTEFKQANAPYTITVWGAAPGGGGNIFFGGAQGSAQNTAIGTPVAAKNSAGGKFKLSHTFTWDVLSAIAADGRQDIRIANIAEAAAIAEYYEIVISDKDGEIYRMSIDPEIQEKPHLYPILTEKGNTTKWFIGALGGRDIEPKAYIIDPGASGAFIPVANITGVPEKGMAGNRLILAGNVEPPQADNKDIVWSISAAGTTGATISGNIVKVTAPGALKVKATIANGTAEGTDYTKEFDIEILPALAIDDVVFDLADWLDEQDIGPVTGDLDAPLTKSGAPTLEIAADGIKILNAPRDYDTIDLYLTRTEIPMDIYSNYYDVVVTGKLLSAGATKVRLQLPASPWSTLASQTMTGTINEAFELKYEIPRDYAVANIRIAYEGDAPYPDILIQSIVITYRGPREELVEYTINFDYDGATGGNTTTSMKVAETMPVGTLPTPTKDGHTFLGWFDGDTQITAATIVTSALSGKTLKAKWIVTPVDNTTVKYTVPTGDDKNIFFDLNESMAYSNDSGERPRAFIVTAAAKATYTFTVNESFIAVPLTAAMKTALSTAVTNKDTISVVIAGTATPDGAGSRYYLGKFATQGWNISSGSGGWQDNFSSFLNKDQTGITATNVGDITHIIFQVRTGGGVVVLDINSIKIVITPYVPCACCNDTGTCIDEDECDGDMICCCALCILNCENVTLEFQEVWKMNLTVAADTEYAPPASYPPNPWQLSGAPPVTAVVVGADAPRGIKVQDRAADSHGISITVNNQYGLSNVIQGGGSAQLVAGTYKITVTGKAPGLVGKIGFLNESGQPLETDSDSSIDGDDAFTFSLEFPHTQGTLNIRTTYQDTSFVDFIIETVVVEMLKPVIE